jgi:hypothetical protein
MTITLTSAAFAQGGRIPRAHIWDGAHQPPLFAWSGVPAESRDKVLPLLDDPAGGMAHHAAAVDIPPDWTGPGEGRGPASGEPRFRQAINDFDKPGCGGPCPPQGQAPQHCHFRSSALSDASVGAAPGATCVEVQSLAWPLVLAFVELVGVDGR